MRACVHERARPLSYTPLLASGLVEQSSLGVGARAQRPRESEEKFISIAIGGGDKREALYEGNHRETSRHRKRDSSIVAFSSSVGGDDDVVVAVVVIVIIVSARLLFSRSVKVIA